MRYNKNNPIINAMCSIGIEHANNELFDDIVYDEATKKTALMVNGIFDHANIGVGVTPTKKDIEKMCKTVDVCINELHYSDTKTAKLQSSIRSIANMIDTEHELSNAGYIGVMAAIGSIMRPKPSDIMQAPFDDADKEVLATIAQIVFYVFMGTYKPIMDNVVIHLKCL